MAKVEVGRGRSEVERIPGGIKITIPSKKNYLVIGFVGVWLMGWAVGEVVAVASLLGTSSEMDMAAPTLFIIPWLIGWTIGGACAVYLLLWNAFGKEIILLRASELQHIRQIPIFRRSREYDLSAVSGLRAQGSGGGVFGTRSPMEFWGLAGGSIVFDYGQSTHRFGAQLDEAEAEHIVAQIKQQFRNL